MNHLGWSNFSHTPLHPHTPSSGTIFPSLERYKVLLYLYFVSLSLHPDSIKVSSGISHCHSSPSEKGGKLIADTTNCCGLLCALGLLCPIDVSCVTRLVGGFLKGNKKAYPSFHSHCENCSGCASSAAVSPVPHWCSSAQILGHTKPRGTDQHEGAPEAVI